MALSAEDRKWIQGAIDAAVSGLPKEVWGHQMGRTLTPADPPGSPTVWSAANFLRWAYTHAREGRASAVRTEEYLKADQPAVKP